MSKEPPNNPLGSGGYRGDTPGWHSIPCPCSQWAPRQLRNTVQAKIPKFTLRVFLCCVPHQCLAPEWSHPSWRGPWLPCPHLSPAPVPGPVTLPPWAATLLVPSCPVQPGVPCWDHWEGSRDLRAHWHCCGAFTTLQRERTFHVLCHSVLFWWEEAIGAVPCQTPEPAESAALSFGWQANTCPN